MKASKLVLLFILLSSYFLVGFVDAAPYRKGGSPLLIKHGVLTPQDESENGLRPKNETKILFDLFHEPEYNESQLAGFWKYLNSTYTVENNTKTITERVLEDQDVLVLAGPTLNFTSGSDSEIEAITEFLHTNGSLLIMPSRFNKTNIDELTKPFGLAFENNTVIDPVTHYNNSEVLARVTIFDSIPLTANVREVGFYGQNIRINSTEIQPWQPPISFQNVSVDLHAFMWGAPTTTTRENSNITGSDVILGVAMETSLGARLVGVGSSAIVNTTFVTYENTTAESGESRFDLQSAFGDTAVFLKNIMEWLAKLSGVITYRDFVVDVLGNNTSTTIDYGTNITGTIIITDQNGTVIERLNSEDPPIFGLKKTEQIKSNVTMTAEVNGTYFGTIDTTGMFRGWVTPTVSVHTRGYSYLEVSNGKVYINPPPSPLYTEPIGIFFLSSLVAEIMIFAATAVWAWRNLPLTKEFPEK
ncbi:MAG: hypothetical protein ACE5R6_00715 [Candidatus Heimdallarchaeota archaeon]